MEQKKTAGVTENLDQCNKWNRKLIIRTSLTRLNENRVSHFSHFQRVFLLKEFRFSERTPGFGEVCQSGYPIKDLLPPNFGVTSLAFSMLFLSGFMEAKTLTSLQL